MNNWWVKKLKDYTIQDALDAFREGFITVIGDGKIAYQQNYED